MFCQTDSVCPDAATTSSLCPRGQLMRHHWHNDRGIRTSKDLAVVFQEPHVERKDVERWEGKGASKMVVRVAVLHNGLRDPVTAGKAVSLSRQSRFVGRRRRRGRRID